MKSWTFITGISDFHAFTTSISKLTYIKSNPKIKYYRDYKSFDNDLFQVDVEHGLRNLTDVTYNNFEEGSLRTLDDHAAMKKMYEPMKILSWVKLCVKPSWCVLE